MSIIRPRNPSNVAAYPQPPRSACPPAFNVDSSTPSQTLPIRRADKHRRQSSRDTRSDYRHSTISDLTEDVLRPGDLRYGSMVDLTEPSSMITCDNCYKGIQDELMHCTACNNGDFDLCFECIDRGIQCPGGESHVMIKGVFPRSRASRIERDIVPLLQQLVEKNNVLYGLLLRNSLAHLPPPPPPLPAMIKVHSPNLRNGVHKEVPNPATHGSANNISQILPSHAGPDQTSFPLESNTTRGQAPTMPTRLPETRWLVPYGTYITGDGSGVLPGNDMMDAGPSSEIVTRNNSQSGSVNVPRSEQGSRDQSAPSKYVDLLLESEYLTDAEIDQHKEMKRRFLEESKVLTQICTIHADFSRHAIQPV
jgi:hypothetical protein